jgi:hypothetical protein
MSLFPLLLMPNLHQPYLPITTPIMTPQALSHLWRLCLRLRLLLLLHLFMMMLLTCLLYMMMPVVSLVAVVLLVLHRVLVSLPMIPTRIACLVPRVNL